MIQETSSRNEMKETNNNPIEGFKNIKPETELSIGDLGNAVNAAFNSAAIEMKGQDTATSETYQDDNGNDYRIGDNLIPNNEFVIDGYKYVTDEKGRVISAEGTLQVKDHDGRKEMDSRDKVNRGDMRDTDDRGHLIADRFNGSGGIENLVAMDSKLNQGDYAKLEKKLADAVDSGAKVDLKVQPTYDKDSTRPTEFRVTYTIDGTKSVTVFKNGSDN